MLATGGPAGPPVRFGAPGRALTYLEVKVLYTPSLDFHVGQFA